MESKMEWHVDLNGNMAFGHQQAAGEIASGPVTAFGIVLRSADRRAKTMADLLMMVHRLHVPETHAALQAIREISVDDLGQHFTVELRSIAGGMVISADLAEAIVNPLFDIDRRYLEYEGTVQFPDGSTYRITPARKAELTLSKSRIVKIKSE